MDHDRLGAWHGDGHGLALDSQTPNRSGLEYFPSTLYQQILLSNDDKSNYITQRAMVNFAEFYGHYHGENPRNYMNGLRELAKNAEKSQAVATETTNTPSCPRCGKALIVRETKKGMYMGDKFYGCSAFPQCHYADYSKETKAMLKENKE